MYKKQKTLKSFLNSDIDNNELFSRNSMTTIIRTMLEPVANQNAASLIFTRLKNKEGVEGLIKRLEYCTNVEMVDVTAPNILIKDNYVELEFVIFTSARYNFVLIFDYSIDEEKNYTKLFFLTNSRKVNDVFESLQDNMNEDYREKFYRHRPERRENELLNEALSNVLKKLNNNIEENTYKENNSFVVDLTDENDIDEKIKETSHEIKNQLSVLDVYLKLIEKQTGKNKYIDVIKKASANIYFQLNNLKNYETTEIKELVIQDILDDSIHMFDEVVKENNNKIEYMGEGYDVHAFADENKLLSVLSNIIKNANESTENDTIQINLETKGNYCKIQITNHGSKVEDTAKKHLFDKGFTTRQKGSGIGLYVCRKYIEEMNGKLVLLESTDDKTTFEISLPIN